MTRQRTIFGCAPLPEHLEPGECSDRERSRRDIFSRRGRIPRLGFQCLALLEAPEAVSHGSSRIGGVCDPNPRATRNRSARPAHREEDPAVQVGCNLSKRRKAKPMRPTKHRKGQQQKPPALPIWGKKECPERGPWSTLAPLALVLAGCGCSHPVGAAACYAENDAEFLEVVQSCRERGLTYDECPELVEAERRQREQDKGCRR